MFIRRGRWWVLTLLIEDHHNRLRILEHQEALALGRRSHHFHVAMMIYIALSFPTS